MHVAALNDIHGNLPALEAVLAEVREVGVDRIVVGGDVVVGPMSREVVTCLLDLDVPVDFLVGNAEVAVLEALAGLTPARVPEQHQPIIQWTADQHHGHEQVIASWPKTVHMTIPGVGETLFCHATPRDENEIFTRMTPENRLVPIFEGLGADVVVCGHTHMQFDRRIGAVRVLNAGSVGMPFCSPGAYWLLFIGGDIQLRRTMYDFASAAERIRATGFPQVEDLSVRYLFNPPTEEEILAAYAPAELR